MEEFAGNPYLETSLWVVVVAVWTALSLAREIGLRIRLWRMRRVPYGASEDAFTLSSALGLLALLITFTFSLSLTRYDQRRELVVQEANALGTTWLRAQLLDEPGRSKLSEELRTYTKLRIDYGEASTKAAEEAAYHESIAEHDHLWPVLGEAIASIRGTPLAAFLVASANEAIDVAATRQATRAAHVPERVLSALILFAIVTAGLIGYEKGQFRFTTSLLFVLISLAITLILDLDRPRSGAIQVSQRPMEDLWTSIAGPVHP